MKWRMAKFEEFLMRLGMNLKSGRKGRGLTQEDLAERAGLHRTYVADVERGARNVSIMNVGRLAGALGISVSELCSGIDQAPKTDEAKAQQSCTTTEKAVTGEVDAKSEH